MKNIFLIAITCLILNSCTKEIIKTPYEFANMQIEEVEYTPEGFYGKINMKNDTISVILEDVIPVKKSDSLKFREFEAYHFSSGKPEVEIDISFNSFFPSIPIEDEDASDVKVGRYRISFDLIGINPGKFEASVFLNGYHTLKYP